MIIAIAVCCSIGVLAAVFVVGGMYQQELFDEYMEDSQNSPNTRDFGSPELPVIEIP